MQHIEVGHLTLISHYSGHVTSTIDFTHILQKSLPQLKEQMKNELRRTNAELKKYGTDPPSDEADRLTFLNFVSLH